MTLLISAVVETVRNLILLVSITNKWISWCQKCRAWLWRRERDCDGHWPSLVRMSIVHRFATELHLFKWFNRWNSFGNIRNKIFTECRIKDPKNWTLEYCDSQHICRTVNWHIFLLTIGMDGTNTLTSQTGFICWLLEAMRSNFGNWILSYFFKNIFTRNLLLVPKKRWKN